MKFFNHLLYRWRELLRARRFVISLASGFLLLFISLVINFYASRYTESVPALSVGDLILDNIRTIDLSFFYTTGIFVVIVLLILYPVLFEPEIAPFTLKTIAAFIIIRSFFVSLTHIAPPADFYRYVPTFDEQAGLIQFFYLNDLFFSGHTGLPFLGALLFWKNPIVRYFLLIMSFIQAVTVLFLHVHYSIDVFSAYFITYSIYVVSDKIFNTLNLSFRRIVARLEKRERRLLRFLRKTE